MTMPNSHDPLTVLAGGELPVQPDPAFAARLRERLAAAVTSHALFSVLPSSAGHDGNYNFSTCANSSSTGVARPKIDTATFRRLRAASISSTVPLNDANGPSDTRTCSPISNEIDDFGCSIPSCT